MALRWLVLPWVAALGLSGLLLACSPPPSPAPAPALDARHALPNLQRLSAEIWSGGAPAGAAGFAQLRALGVRTVISVDGATPDVSGARAQGLRYVHVPVTYAEVSQAQRLELARAIRDLPGPVYVHCHHGKHRSPAAAASAAVALGLIDPAAGMAFLERAGTSPSYAGLWACVAEAGPATPIELDAAPAEFPPVRRAEGLVASMLEVEQAHDHLGAIRAAGWVVPRTHPDLVPAAEAGRLTDNLRLGAEDARIHGGDPDLAGRFERAVEAATALEAALAGRAPAESLEARWAPLETSCKQCHAAHRDKR